jgi:KDEL-tailed cysteine endopeptidase
MRQLLKIFFFFLCLAIVKNNDFQYNKEKREILEQYMLKTPKELFKVWHMLFQKSYTFDSEEAKNRFQVFKANLEQIKKVNAENKGFKLGLNQFSDMTNEEFRAKMTTYKPIGEALEEMSNSTSNNMNGDVKFLPADDEDDLTKRNLQSQLPINYSKYYRAPRDQLQCGGCWAFALTGAIEGNVSKKRGIISNYLSPQHLIDCVSGNLGCSGGDMRTGDNYVIAKGLMNEADYNFQGYTSVCRYNNLRPLTFITGYKYCSNATRYKCSTSLIYSLLTKGPVAVTIDGGSFGFQNYASGIFSDYCSQVNHALVLVGYGSSGQQNYYLLRNSWSSYWGENGYIRVAVNPSNSFSCFIEYEAVVPEV